MKTEPDTQLTPDEFYNIFKLNEELPQMMLADDTVDEHKLAEISDRLERAKNAMDRLAQARIRSTYAPA